MKNKYGRTWILFMNWTNRRITAIPKLIRFGLLGLLIVVDFIAIDMSDLLKSIKIFDVSNAYDTIVNLFPNISEYSKEHLYLFLALTIVFLVLLVYKPALLLIKHSSFENNLSEVDRGFTKLYHVRKIDMDQSGLIIDNFPTVEAIKKQDSVAYKIEEIRKNALVAYYGIAHTPFVFRFGFMLNDQCSEKILHQPRKNEARFAEWVNDSSNMYVNHYEKNTSRKSNELIVAISTSMKIIPEDLVSLDPNNKHIVLFSTNNIGFDVIQSYSDAENIRTYILQNIRAIVKKYSIRKIHLVMSSSIGFTFFLAKGFSPQHDPTIIVYHYINGTYPWGICANATADKAIIINENCAE